MPLPRDWEGKVFEKLTELDNGNTIIVFESSHTGKPSDTLIQAREEIEVRWRRLMLYLNREEQSEDRLAMECMDLVLRDIFKGLQIRWEKTMNKCEAHVNTLEDKVYENPADESRAPELWSNSAMWLKLEKLISLHTVTVNDLQQQMRDLSESEEFIKEDWFKDTPADLERIAKLFDEEMVKPTANLSDLLYKSVEIRDSRHSLQLGTSMWRLSWITFIFLPLTFMVGFFGMNVDVFQPEDSHFPSIKWYFVAAIPLMLIIIIMYMFIKSSLSTSHDIPMQRGVYEQIYNQFAADHPHLWSRIGPRAYVKPKGVWGKLKWRIVKKWFNPKRTIARKTYNEIDEMGLWARLKRSLAQRWLAQIEAAPGSGVDEEYGDGGMEGEFSTVSELLEVSMPVTMADAWPGVADAPATPPLMGRVFSRMRRSSSGSRPAGGRTTSPGSEMVVEEEKSDDETKARRRREEQKKEMEKEGTTTVVDHASATVGGAGGVASDSSHFTTGFLNVPFNNKRSEEHVSE
jgi:Mg2+ and Co2+ transporter CorA